MTWTSPAARWFPPVAALLLLVSCSGDAPPERELPPGVTEGTPDIGVGTATATPSPTASQLAAECPNEARAFDPAFQLGTSATADVNGDGVQDQVRLAVDASSSNTACSAFVVVGIGGGTTIIGAPVWEIGSQGGLPNPRIHGFVDIDGRPGDEILIDEAAGASTQFVGAFVVIDDDLQRITVKGGTGASDVSGVADLFPYGGSVGHVEAADCTDEGVVVSVATPSFEQGDAAEGIYEVERRHFVFEGSVLEKESVEVHDVPIDQLERFPEYGASPFGSC